MFNMHIFFVQTTSFFFLGSLISIAYCGGKGRKLMSVQTLVAKYDPKNPIPHSHMNMYVVMSLMHTFNLFVFSLY